MTRGDHRSPTHSPQISVIIPVRNDPLGLRTTVESLLEQGYPRDGFEIIIADNRSVDDTLTVARGLAESRGVKVTVVEEKATLSSYAARNLGISIARGEVLTFIDADMIAPPGFLDAISGALAGDLGYLGCRVEVFAEERTLSALYNWFRGFPVDRYLERQHFAPTCALSVRRSTVDRVGAFDARLRSSGDLEFGHRVFQAGIRQGYAPDIVLRHPARTSYRGLLRKAFRLGTGLAQLARYHGKRFPGAGKRFLRIRSYLPLHPRKLRGKAIARGIELSRPEVLMLSMWHIPLEVAQLAGFVFESGRLARNPAGSAPAGQVEGA